MSDSNAEPRVALVVTDRAVEISVAPLDDERTPDGMVCLGTRLAGNLVARCVVPPEAADFLADRAIFAEPVRLALAAEEADPGLQCRLFALVSLPAGVEEEEPTEPWADSVPSSAYERDVADGDDRQPQQAAILLGHVVRFEQDRRHPGSLPLEAADVLATIVSGRVSEVIDKVIRDLLDS